MISYCLLADKPRHIQALTASILNLHVYTSCDIVTSAFRFNVHNFTLNIQINIFDKPMIQPYKNQQESFFEIYIRHSFIIIIVLLFTVGHSQMTKPNGIKTMQTCSARLRSLLACFSASAAAPLAYPMVTRLS